jgi:hypothetical protein
MMVKVLRQLFSVGNFSFRQILGQMTINKIIISLIAILLTACGQPKNDEFKGFRVIKISMGEKAFLRLSDNKVLSDKIIQDIYSAKIIKGPVKGIGIEITLYRNTDTIKLLSYAGSEYFRYNRKFYKANHNILPDSIVSKFIN